MRKQTPTRREFLQKTATLAVAGSAQYAWPAAVTAKEAVANADSGGSGFRLSYILASPMYGQAPLIEVLPEIRKIGARHIDIWPLPHANHREQVDQVGRERFAEMLSEHDVKLGVITRYDLGAQRINDELPTLKKLGGRMLVTGAGRGKGDSEKERVRQFVEAMRPQVDEAEAEGIVLGIENHENTLLQTPDSIRWFAEMHDSHHFGLAMAPYHLPQAPETIARLIRDLGPKLVFFQGWQHGNGCAKKLPKDEELLQMPGRGPLDFRPIVDALRKINYRGWTEIFMHPVPRGISILDSTPAVTAEINRARTYLDRCLSDED